MATRRIRAADPAELTIETTKAVEYHLQSLVSTGLYGKTASEAAERLLCEALRVMNLATPVWVDRDGEEED
jgi:hypothetical protein